MVDFEKIIETEAMVSLKNEADKALIQVNEALTNNKKTEIDKANKALTEAVKAYNVDLRKTFYNKLIKEAPEGEAFKIAIKDHMLIPCLVAKNDKVEDGETPRMKLMMGETFIDLAALEIHAHKPLAANAGWRYVVERFNAVVNARCAIELGMDAKEFKGAFYQSDEANKVGMAVPTSTNKITDLLQETVNAIVFISGEDGKNTLKVLKRDTRFILSVYTKHGKKAQAVAMCTEKSMRQFVTEVMNRLLNSTEYKVEDMAEAPKA